MDRSLTDLVVLHRRVVLATNGSHATRIEGRIKITIAAEISAPRASIRHIMLMISILEIIATPNVAQKSTSELVMMEL